MLKTIKVTAKLHKRIKLQAAKEEITILALIIKMFKTYMSTTLLLLIITSCSSTYTKIDKPNYDRYTHDQKIEKGLSTRDVMNMFGSPQHVSRGNYSTKFTYYRGIHCQSLYCSVTFIDNEVTDFNSFRQEYINFLGE